ncbi:MAG: hydrogenase/urease maturation nickel metallochaperone HypA [Endomicrobia bacterium]|nr:hydrogenase/urease maturation nickel metallochaperone HypA [Endomicrobiia bacterium]
MHEHSLAKDIAYLIFDEIKKKKPKKVEKITIVIGEALGINKDFFLHALKEHSLKNTICENSQLEIVVEKAKIKCRKCSNIIEEPVMKCICGSNDFDVFSGKNVYVKEILAE